MDFKGRALFNVLRINYRDGIITDVKPWQVEEYRSMTLPALLQRLGNLQIYLDPQSFQLYVNECDSPEELADCLFDENSTLDERQQIYLLVFELWRRLAKEKQTLSIFCDELDHIIEQYEDGVEEVGETLFQSLEAMEDILDEAVDQGSSPRNAFRFVKSFCCHDLEEFLYEYITHLIDQGHETYPSELLDALYEYFENPLGLDLLRIRLLSQVDAANATAMLERLLSTLEEKPQFSLFLGILRYLIYQGDIVQFQSVFGKTTALLTIEEELTELLEVAQEFFQCNEKTEEENAIRAVLDKRESIDPHQPVNKGSKGYKMLSTLPFDSAFTL